VSNSSSSSFLIPLAVLSPLQRVLIEKHGEIGEALGLNFANTDAWSVHVEGVKLSGWTCMDNFDMKEYFTIIGVDTKYIDSDDCR
jgi:hypothetical protein